MIKNYIKIAFRNIRKQKLFSLINIFGLTLGITCCMLIYLFTSDEFSYDKFHKNIDNLYIVQKVSYQKPPSQIDPNPFFDTSSPDGVRRSPWLPIPLGPEIKAQLSEIKAIIREDYSTLLVRNGSRSFDEEVTFVDPSFLTSLSFPLIEGSKETALNDPNSIVLTPETSTRFFGSEDPIGKSLLITIQNEEKSFTVTGVAKAAPKNSSIKFSMLTNIVNKPYYDFHLTRWHSFNTPLFIELKNGINITDVEHKINELTEERYRDSRNAGREQLGFLPDETISEFKIIPFSTLHLDAGSGWPSSSNILYSYILGAIAFLILLIASINYITLALSRSSGRAKEVGVRKASGALQNHIALQFWGETQILTLFAMIAGIGLTEAVLPLFNKLTEKSLSISYFENIEFYALLFGITFITGLIAGSYPALVLSRHQPARVLKGLTKVQFKPRLTKALLVVQFSLSIFLIISAVIMYKQLDFITAKDLGYNKEQVLFIPTYTGFNEEGEKLLARYKNELNGVKGIQYISGLSPAFTKGTNRYGFDIDGVEKQSYIYYIDSELINTLGFELIAGRDFSSERPSDKKNSIIVNEALVTEMGWSNPIGEELPWKGKEDPSTVIGVVKNFHFESLETEIEPMLFQMDNEHGSMTDIAIRLKEGSIAETLPELKSAWNSVAPFTPFNYWFLDEAVNSQYQDYQRWLNIMGLSTFIAILISCLGLFGLAGLTAVSKTKEIGIRKVLGASINQIVYLLNKDIVKLILLSLIIASPLSWFIMQEWLSDFAYQTSIGFGVFAISALSALIIAIITVSYHSIKAAHADPAKSLKTE